MYTIFYNKNKYMCDFLVFITTVVLFFRGLALVLYLASRTGNLGSVYLLRVYDIARVWQLFVIGLHTPDFPGIFSNGAVARKLSRCCYVLDAHFDPFTGFRIHYVDSFLAFNVVFIIR